VRALAIAAGVFALIACTGAHAATGTRTIYVTNGSTMVTDAELADALPAFQQALDQDFAPEWGADATLVQLPAGATVPAGGWSIAISDEPDVFGAAGYHDIGAGHVPFARVFADTGLEWQVTFTHELWEMLADPYCDRTASPAKLGEHTKAGQALYALEVADPVEDQSFAYSRPGADGAPVPISDFVTERWFDGEGGGRFDFAGHVKHALQILTNGYITEYTGGGWTRLPIFYRLPFDRLPVR